MKHLLCRLGFLAGVILLGHSVEAQPPQQNSPLHNSFRDAHPPANPDHDHKNFGFFGAIGRKMVRSHVNRPTFGGRGSVASRVSTDLAYKNSVNTVIGSLHKEGKLNSIEKDFMHSMIANPQQLHNATNSVTFTKILQRY